VDVAHDRRAGEAVEGLGRRIGELAEQALDVERPGAHPVDVALPALAWPVPVDLDPVVVGVAEVDRLADEVVAQACEGDPLAGHVREPAREVGSLGEQEREVVEAGVVVRVRRARLLDEHDQLRVRTERRAAVRPCEQPQADGADPVVEGAIEV
jgi:hypothetical protein